MCKKSCAERICEEKEADVVYGFDWSSYCKLVVEPKEIIPQETLISLPDGGYCTSPDQPSRYVDSEGNLIEN